MASEVLRLHEWTTCTKYSSRRDSDDENSADYHCLLCDCFLPVLQVHTGVS